jgi:hypothetical protein
LCLVGSPASAAAPYLIGTDCAPSQGSRDQVGLRHLENVGDVVGLLGGVLKRREGTAKRMFGTEGGLGRGGARCIQEAARS